MALKYAVFKGYSGEREPLPKKPNKFKENGKALVSQVKGDDVQKAVKLAVQRIGGFKKIIKPGCSVLLKPNLVFPKPNPCTTAPDFLSAVIKACFDAGAGKVVVGERCAYWLKTRNVSAALGIDKVIEKAGGELVFFDEGKWFSVNLGLPYIKRVTLPEAAWQHDVLIHLPCLKTHRLARFTMSLKLTIGLIHPMEMPTMMFMGNLENKIAEINTAVWPDLVIMDARKCFVTSGPDVGDIENPNLILASGDRVAIDAVGVNILKSYKAKNRLEFNNSFDYPQIKHAAELGVGVKSEKGIKVIGVTSRMPITSSL